MAIPKIVGGQTDFSGGEVDVTLKRADENPVRKAGCRQMSNFRILSTGKAQNRSGRTARFLGGTLNRVEEVLMAPGSIFYIGFGPGLLQVYNAAGTQVFTSNLKGDGSTALPWTAPTIKSIVWAAAAAANQFSIYICYGDDAPANVPQILSWDGVSQTSTWTLTTFAEAVTVGQKRTVFYRLSPQNITMQPGGTTGSVSVVFSAPVLVPGMVGTRFEFCGAQLTVTAVTDSTHGTATADQIIPQAQELTYSSSGGQAVTVGQELIGSVTSATGIVTILTPTVATVQLLPDATGLVRFFNATENAVGPTGYLVVSSTGGVNPQPVAIWSDEVMNFFRGFPKSVFYDQGRLGLCNFPSLPSGIGWSAIGLPDDFYAEDASSPDNSIFELAPHKSQVLFVVAGPESSEFVFCDNGVYYILINVTNPLVPGSVSFNVLTRDGSANIQPRLLQDCILFMNAGLSTLMAITAPGAYYRPYEVTNMTTLHSHLIKTPVAIAAPDTTNQFDERYCYLLNSDGSIAVGKYETQNGQIKGVVGFVPFTGAGTTNWIAALASDVIFTTSYFGTNIVEVLDDTQYLDSALLVNTPPAAFTPPGGKGPLWFIAGQSVTLIDLGTRMMGTYQIDGNGNIIPQFIGGENLASSQLVAGQPWTATLEPFVPDANPGNSVHQRMFKRRVSRMAVYVSNSTGFLMARLFSGPLTRTSPALGTIMNTRRVPAWNQDDDPTQPPPLREEAQRWRPLGRAFDPRVCVIKDTPGPLVIEEFGLEASI